MSKVARINELRFVAPVASKAFYELNLALRDAYQKKKLKTWFRPFETFRHPARQADLFDMEPPVTKLDAMLSPHQYGLAVDFVPWIEDDQKWSWADEHDYEALEVFAKKVGLRVPITWDLCHVEHPAWDEIKSIVRRK